MVDPIGPRPVKPNDRIVVPVTRAAAAPLVLGEQPHGAQALGVRTQAKELSARPPVDSGRVEEIRRAIANGRFPIEPTTIADRLIALKNKWVPND